MYKTSTNPGVLIAGPIRITRNLLDRLFLICRFGVKRTGQAITLKGRLALTPQCAVHLIAVENRQILIATSPQGVQLLDIGTLQSDGESGG